MTKAELLSSLATKFYKVPSETLKNSELGINLYEVYPYLKSGDIVLRQYVSFYVENEGEVDEVAYWGNSEPYPTVVKKSFFNKVQTFLNGKIASGAQIKFAWIVASNELQKKAYVSGFTATNVTKNGIVSEDAEGVLSIELF
jgi:hypothetical protein